MKTQSKYSGQNCAHWCIFQNEEIKRFLDQSRPVF